MQNEEETVLYYVWGADRIVYGPVELPTLVDWVRDDRVLPETWIFHGDVNEWMTANSLPELKAILGRRTRGATADAGQKRIPAGALRRIKVFAEMENQALDSLLRYMQPLEVPAFQVVVRAGEPADAMYFVLEGEVRAYVLLDGKESTLATLAAGETFGEVALLDAGNRSAYVAANSPSLLLRLPASSFQRILREAPSLAAPFVMGLARQLAARLRAIGKRYEDSIRFSRTATGPG